MKNFSVLVLLMTAVTFTGCKKDDEDKQKDNNRVAIAFQDEQPDDYEIRKLNSNEMVLYVEDEDGPKR